jgi:hypothetical protein
MPESTHNVRKIYRLRYKSLDCEGEEKDQVLNSSRNQLEPKLWQTSVKVHLS